VIPTHGESALRPRRWPVARGHRRCTSAGPGWVLWRKRRGAARCSRRLAVARHQWRMWRHLWRVQMARMDRRAPVEWRMTNSPWEVPASRWLGWSPWLWDRRELVQWCLGGCHVGQKSPIVQHAQESTELTGRLGWVAVLEMGHSFFQRFGTLGGHLISNEGDLVCSKDTSLGWWGSCTSQVSRKEPVGVARALQVTGIKRRCQQWSIVMSGRRCASGSTWRGTRIGRMEW
jgi:hypothetical protein